MRVGLRTPKGSKRVTLEDDATVQTLFTKVAEAIGATETFCLVHEKKEIAPDAVEKPVAALGIKNGSLLTVKFASSGAPADAGPAPKQLDAIDQVMYKRDGMVHRKPDPVWCRHGDGRMCSHCTPLEPWDPAVLNKRDPPIKFLSFHAHLRQLDSGADRGRFTVLPDMVCTARPPWPKDMSLHALPPTILLSRQKYRHVDYVQFERHAILDEFINWWRKTGTQRVGFLYGRYEPYDQVPLGIRATVTAIYEPPQVGAEDSVQLLEDPHKARVDEAAAAIGLQEVGWVFTDLVQTAEGIQTTRMTSDDPEQTVFTATEVLNAASLQLKHPNIVPTRYNPSQVYGSKYVTVVVTGEDGGVVTRAYQATAQAMAMVRDDIVGVQDPSHVSLRPTSEEQYVPDVFHKHIDEFGNEAKAKAEPAFPVEFLMVDLESGGYLDAENSTFPVADRPFPTENRQEIAPLDHGAIRAHLEQDAPLLAKLSDFHLLVYLVTDDMCSMLHEALPTLYSAIKQQDEAQAAAFTENGHWKTIMMIASEAGGGDVAAGGPGPAPAAEPTWACKHCTIVNQQSAPSCSMCGLPR